MQANDLVAAHAETRVVLPAMMTVSPYLQPGVLQGSTNKSGVRLVNPIPPAMEITSGFGARKNPFTGLLAQHTGIDLKAAIGTPVVAAGDAVVEVATTQYQDKKDWGTVIILDHGDGLKTFYSHLDSLTVRPGQRVEAGQAIGAAGETGRVTGPHLHFEVWKDGEAVDPMPYVNDGC